MIAGPDFGTGSSREHAVWALENYGFKVVIGSRFGDIFRGNSGKPGLLIAVVDQKIIEELWDFVEEHPAHPSPSTSSADRSPPMVSTPNSRSTTTPGGGCWRAWTTSG